MNETPEIVCEDCGWQGSTFELVCSDDDLDLPISEIKFNRCPNCESENIADWE